MHTSKKSFDSHPLYLTTIQNPLFRSKTNVWQLTRLIASLVSLSTFVRAAPQTKCDDNGVGDETLHMSHESLFSSGSEQEIQEACEESEPKAKTHVETEKPKSLVLSDDQFEEIRIQIEENIEIFRPWIRTVIKAMPYLGMETEKELDFAHNRLCIRHALYDTTKKAFMYIVDGKPTTNHFLMYDTVRNIEKGIGTELVKTALQNLTSEAIATGDKKIVKIVNDVFKHLRIVSASNIAAIKQLGYMIDEEYTREYLKFMEKYNAEKKVTDEERNDQKEIESDHHDTDSSSDSAITGDTDDNTKNDN